MNRTIATVPTETARRRRILETRLRELLLPAGERGEVQIEPSADPVDQMASSANREMALRRLDQRTHLIREVRSALAKLGQGAYGLCEECGEPIPPKRLEALPWARFCVRCQSAAESGMGGAAVEFGHAA